ncbi:MAG: transporter substrate-binding domain-containing protein [Oscillospiraceae bacterium]|nr:transporter substrate-binding domain-containing protein [Oscillospiraceae bacterium]
MKKIRFTALLTAMLLCLSSLAACSQSAGQQSSSPSPAGDTVQSEAPADLLAQIRERGEIVIALEGTWAPWGYHDESDTLVGYDVEIAQAIADKLGVKATFAEGEWSGLLAGLDSGRYDIMVNGVDIDEDRKLKYDFSTPYAYNRTAVIVSGDNEDIHSMEDLDGKQTANTLSSTYANVAESYGAEVIGVDDFIQTIELLHSGRIDATLNAEVSYYDYLAQHPEDTIKIACIDPATTQVAIPLRKGEESAALLTAINEALAELAEDGTLTDLSIKYFGTDISKDQ